MKTSIRILHLEDDQNDIELIQSILEEAGLICRINIAQTRDEFEKALRQDECDIILADYQLPMYDGMSALRLAQELRPDIPFVFVSGTMGEEAAIEGLKQGATDYLLKQKMLRLASAVERALHEADLRRKRKLAQKALEESEAKMRGIMENIGIGVALISPKMEILELNARMREWFPAVDPRQRPICYQAYNDPPRKEICDYCPICKTLQDGLVHEAVTQTPRAGVIHNYRIVSSPLFNKVGAVAAAIEMVEDITELRRSQDDLKRSNDMLQAIIEAAPTAIIGLDLEGHVHSVWNKAAEEMLGWSAQEVMGRPLPTVPADRRDEFRRFREQVRKGLTLNDVEVRRRRRDGSPIDYSIYASPLHDTEGRISGNIAVLMDITERKQAERERLANLRFFESMDKVNKVIQGAGDLEELMRELLDVVLSIFDCDRAFLMNPCDPESPTWTSPMERNKPEYPGVLELGLEVPMDSHVAETLRILLAADGPVTFGPGTPHTVAEDVPKRFGIKSFMSMAIYPRAESPWQFGIHQCADARVWTSEETRIFEAIGRRLADGLSSLLAYRRLQESEERYRLIAENTADTISVFDLNLKPIYTSPSVLNLRGYTVQEAMAQSLDQVLTPESVQKAKKIFTEQLALEESGEADPSRTVLLELEEFRKDGSTIWVELAISALRDNNLQPTGLLTVSRDITERKQAEEALRVSEERYRALYHENPSMFFTLDAEGTIISVNDFGASQLGYTKDELEGQPVLKVFCEEDKAAASEQLKICLQDPWQVYHWQLRKVRKDGSPMWVEEHARAVSKPDGEIYILVVCQDITNRKQAEESIRKLSQAVEQSPVSIVITDSSGNIEFVNTKFTQITGYSATEVLGQNPKILKSDETPAEEYDRLWKTISSGGVWHGEFHNRKKNGDLFWEQATIAPVRNAENAITHYVAVKEDVTERKKLEDQLHQTQKMESVGRLAGGVAHDFNNILGVIGGYTELALDRVDTTHPLYNDLQEIQKASARSVNLTRQLLAFARKQTVAPKVLDLNQIIEGMLSMLRRLIGEDIKVDWKPGKSLWSVRVDPSQIDQILANLCVNARDAMPGVGKLTIETGNKTFDADYCAGHPGLNPGEYVLLAVSDEGNGMDKKTMDRIFEPFFTTKEMGRGTGLGLSTVYGIVKQNNGFIYVYSEVGHGTIFKIYLPRHLTLSWQQEKKSPEIVDSQGDETILLVEDDPATLQVGKRMLEIFGYRVLTAAMPSEAIRVAEKHADEIHLLITDVIMPEMNGQELVDKLTSLYPGLKYLFMSGYTGDTIARRGVLNEGENFIQKPFSTHALSTMVRKVLDWKSDGDDLGRNTSPETENSNRMAKHSGKDYDIDESIVQEDETGGLSSEEILALKAFSRIPGDLPADLKQAILELDQDRIEAVIEQIGELNPSIEQFLADLANDFQFEKLLALIDKERNEGT